MSLDPIQRPEPHELRTADGQDAHEPGKAPSAEIRSVERNEQRLVDAITHLLTNEQGRVFLSVIMGFCEPYKANDERDEFHRGVHEGRRRVAHRIIDLMQRTSPHAYPDWLKWNASYIVGVREQERLIAEREQQKESLLKRTMRYTAGLLTRRN